MPAGRARRGQPPRGVLLAARSRHLATFAGPCSARPRHRRRVRRRDRPASPGLSRWWPGSAPPGCSDPPARHAVRSPRSRPTDACAVRRGARLADQAERFSRPLRRRAAMMARPARVRMRRRKPWVFARRRLFGWKVRFDTSSSVRSLGHRHDGGQLCPPDLEHAGRRATTSRGVAVGGHASRNRRERL